MLLQKKKTQPKNLIQGLVISAIQSLWTFHSDFRRNQVQKAAQCMLHMRHPGLFLKVERGLRSLSATRVSSILSVQTKESSSNCTNVARSGGKNFLVLASVGTEPSIDSTES